MSNLTKKKIIACVAVKHGISQAKAEQMLTSVFELMTESFDREEPVMISGFGKFTPVRKQARTIIGLGGSHPIGETVKIKFRLSGKMREHLNHKKDNDKKVMVSAFKKVSGRD